MSAEIFSIYNLVEAVWLIIPAYAANGLAPLARGKTPIDMGKNFVDKEPLFGSGKTWKGLIFGSFVAILVAAFMQFAHPYLPWATSPKPLDIIPMSVFTGLLLGLGAMLGDLSKSFLKRRLKMARGKMAPIMDQDDFVLGSFLLTSAFFATQIQWLILLLIITPLFHLLANFMAFGLKIKKEPW